MERYKVGVYQIDDLELGVASELPLDADNVYFDNTGSFISSSNVQDAISEAGSPISNRVIVREASDLINIDSSKLYVIDGKIDMGTQQIEIPEGGFFCEGLGYFVSSLYSSADNYTMFVNKTGSSYSGDVIMGGVTLLTSGTNSQIFNLDNAGNFSAIEFNSVNFGDFSAATTSVGTISNYRQFRTRDFALINVNDGLTFEGTWSGGMRIFESILISLGASCIAFKKGSNLSIQGSFVSDINALSSIGNNNNVVFDFSESNFVQDWAFNLDGARFKGSFAIPNISETSTKRFFADCTGVKNTRVGASWSLTSEVQTLLSQNTPTKLLGTTSYDSVIHFSTLNNNEFVYNSSVKDDFFISGYITLEGSPNREVKIIIRKWNASLSSYEDIATYKRFITNVVGNIDIGAYGIGSPAELEINDRVELWVENLTDSTNVTLQAGSYLRIKREV